jgi:hypothetical protein
MWTARKASAAGGVATATVVAADLQHRIGAAEDVSYLHSPEIAKYPIPLRLEFPVAAKARSRQRLFRVED